MTQIELGLPGVLGNKGTCRFITGSMGTSRIYLGT